MVNSFLEFVNCNPPVLNIYWPEFAIQGVLSVVEC